MKFFLATILSAVALATLVQGQEWIKWKASQGVPRFVIPNGRERDYRPLYLVRALISDELTPGKYVAEDGKAYLPLRGQEWQVYEFDFFMGTSVKWIPAANGVTPSKAVVGGNIRGNETLYIGRVYYENSITLGKIVPKDGLLYIPYGQQELKFKEYEQLVYA